MTHKIVNTTIEILGKLYPIRCPESELQSLHQAAELLARQMQEVQNSGKVINLERIAIITALNIAHQFLQLDQQTSHFMHTLNQRISQLQNKLDRSMNKALQTELIYTTE